MSRALAGSHATAGPGTVARWRPHHDLEWELRQPLGMDETTNEGRRKPTALSKSGYRKDKKPWCGSEG